VYRFGKIVMIAGHFTDPDEFPAPAADSFPAGDEHSTAFWMSWAGMDGGGLALQIPPSLSHQLLIGEPGEMRPAPTARRWVLLRGRGIGISPHGDHGGFSVWVRTSLAKSSAAASRASMDGSSWTSPVRS
jgi:hypothetical protein